MQSTCPDAPVWRTYLNGSIATADRAAAESHLATCHLCRERLIELFDTANEQAVHTLPPGLRNRALQLAPERTTARPFLSFFRPYVPLAVAAMFVLAVGLSVLVYRNQIGTQRPAEFRQTERSGGEIPLTNPPNGAALSDGKLEFRWGDAGAGARYEFTVTDEKGDIIFQEKPTSNSLLVESSGLRVSRQRKYYWSVIARMPDGTRRESGISGFTLK